MKKQSQYIFVLLTSFLFVFGGCQEEEYKLGDLIVPANVSLNYVIEGADETNPAGDGSGVVHFIASADNAITFNYLFGDGKDNKISPDGKVSHVFSKTGINKYHVTVFAVGTGGILSSTSIPVEVFSSFTDEEAANFLTGGSSKSWYWAADQPGHLGLGPNDQVYDNGSHTYAAWYNAAPFEKSASSLYDGEFVFSMEGENVKFEQKNPTGEAFIQGVYAGELGFGAEGSYTFDIAGVKNVSFAPSSSIATIDGGYRGTTMNFSNGGFMGFYAGSSEYEIIQVTENILKVRVVQTNTPLFAWYHIFTAVKP